MGLSARVPPVLQALSALALGVLDALVDAALDLDFFGDAVPTGAPVLECTYEAPAAGFEGPQGWVRLVAKNAVWWSGTGYSRDHPAATGRRPSAAPHPPERAADPPV